MTSLQSNNHLYQSLYYLFVTIAIIITPFLTSCHPEYSPSSLHHHHDNHSWQKHIHIVHHIPKQSSFMIPWAPSINCNWIITHSKVVKLAVIIKSCLKHFPTYSTVKLMTLTLPCYMIWYNIFSVCMYMIMCCICMSR